MTTLHIITSNNSFDALSEQAFLVQSEDAIVLMAEGVYCALQTQNLHRPVYVLSEDLKLRGISSESISGTLINYGELPDLITEFKRSISW